MKRLSIALIVVMVLAFVTPALAVYTISYDSAFHDGLIRFYDEATKKYGYMDTEGNVVIKAQYALADDFFNGNAVVSKKNPPETMIINTRGEVVLKTPNQNYVFETSLIQGALTAHVREIKNGRLDYKGFVLINEKGKVITSKPLMFVFPFDENGLALVGEGNMPKSGATITSSGNVYYMATWNGNTPVYAASRYYFIDRNGKRISDTYDACNLFSEGFAVVQKLQKNGEWAYGYIDTRGKEIVAPKYKWAGEFTGGLAPVFDGKWGFINTSGDVAVELKYDLVNYFKDGLAVVATGEDDDMKYGYIDTEGNAVIDEIYDKAGGFQNGVAAVQSGIMWGFIDKSGSWVVSPQYKLVNRIGDTGLFAVQEPSVPQIVNENGDFIDVVTNGKTYKDGAPVMKVEIPFGDFNMINFLDESGEFTCINGVDNGIGGEEFFVKNGSGMLGIIDGQGNEIAPAIYESISASTDDSGIILVCKDGKYGYLSKEGKALTKTVYDRASVFDGAGIAWKGNVWYIIGPDGTEHY